MKDIIITLPKTISWSDYEKELAEAEKGAIMNYKVNHLPKESGKGAKCYITHNGIIRGYMIIHDLVPNNFICSVTGKHWEGNFIQRTGNFYGIKGRIPMAGFQGVRYFDLDQHLNNNKVNYEKR